MTLGVLLASGLALVSSERTEVYGQVPQYNILVILTDDQEASTLEYMGNIQQEVASQGKVFSDTVFTFPLCCPSRATIQTGLYPHNTRVLDNRFPAGGYKKFKRRGLARNTAAVWLNAAGYHTGYFGKYMNGWDGSRVPGWDVFWSYHTGDERRMRFKDANAYDRALSFLESTPQDEPFYEFVSFYAPHAPFYHPEAYNSLFRDIEAPRTPNMNEADVSDKPKYVRSRDLLKMGEVDEKYRKALRSLVRVDNFVKASVDLLRDKGELENTYILFYTDNGSHTGYHRLGYGKRTPYEEDINFPLIVRGPGIPAEEKGTTSDALVGNHDIAPTIAELAGVEPLANVDGRSIVPLFSGTPAEWREAIYIQGGGDGIPRWQGVRTRDEVYVRYGTGERELYDLTSDPYQLQNLMSSEVPPDTATLKAWLEALQSCRGEACRTAENGSSP